MWLHTSCEFKFTLEYPTPFILMLRVRTGGQQWVVSEEYRLNPSVAAFEFIDDYNNLCQRLVAPPGDFSIYTSATVTTPDTINNVAGGALVDIQHLPDNTLKYLLPSRYCESDRFGEMANDITAGQQPGYDQVNTIEGWLRNSIRYQPGSSYQPLSAIEVNNNQVGVCRDLAHLGVALCRSLNIPARIVVGYLYDLKPMDLHAWFEAYIAGQWTIFDATQAERRAGYVAIGHGRDAADVAIYNQFGPAVLPYHQTVQVHKLNGPL